MHGDAPPRDPLQRTRPAPTISVLHGEQARFLTRGLRRRVSLPVWPRLQIWRFHQTVAPVLAAQEAAGIAPELVLQPGSVVNAQVLKILSADLVRIAIASLSIDVASEIPLQAGRDPEACGIADEGRHPPGHGRAGGDAAGVGRTPLRFRPMRWPMRRPTADVVAPKNALTPLERAAVSVAAQAAATEQESLAPLFANLGAVGVHRQSAAKIAAGDCAGAGAADEPRSKPRRQRHQDGVPEIRHFLEASLARVRCPAAAFPISRPR